MKLHLPKGFLKAVLTVMAAFVSFTVQAADTISINFTHGDIGQIPEDTTEITGTLEGIGASGWQNINAVDQTNTSINNQADAAAGTITIANVKNSWQSKIDPSGTLDSYVQEGYIDTPAQEERFYTVAVDHGYWVSDVVFYMSADTANNKYSSLNVNGTSYYGSEGGAVVGNQAWGATGDPAGVTTYDYNNSFKVTGLIGDLVVKNDYSGGVGSGKPRATLAGLQIIDRTAETFYFTTLGTGETDLADTTWSLNGGDAAAYNAETMNCLGVNAAAEGSTLVLNSEENIDLLGIKTGALTLTANADSTLGTVIIDAGTGLDINTAENITVSLGSYLCSGASILTKSGAGTLNMGALSNGKTNVASFNGGITVNAGILQFSGTSVENWPDGVEPAFVQLIRNVTTTGTGKVQVVGDVNFSNQLSTEASSSVAIDDNIEITGNLQINSTATQTAAEADGKKYRLWNIATGGTLTVGEQLWLTNKQKLTLNGGSLNAGSIKLGHAENNDSGPHPSRIVVESGSLKTGSITFWGSGNSFTMTGGSLEFTGSQAISAENGCTNGTFSISGGTLKATQTDWTLASGNGVTVTVGGVTIDEANTHGITLSGVTLNGAITNNKTLTLENVTVAGNVSLTNSGTLTVNGAYSSNNKIENTAADAVINFNGDVTFSAGTGSMIYEVNPGYVITGSGTTNFTGSSIISGTAESPQILSVQNGAKVVVGGGTNTTTMTLGQLRLHDGSTTGTTEIFTVKENAIVTISGEDSSGTGGSAVVLGHWHNGTAELQVAGGQLNVLNGSIRMGWDSNSSFSITDGEANVAKITFRQNEDTDRLTLTGGRLNVGAGGIIVESDAVNESNKANTSVELNGGTLGALYSEGAENQGWTLDGRLTTTIGTLIVDTTAVNADGSSSGTGATITIEKASTASSGSAITLTGSGALVIKEFVAGAGASTFGQQEGSSATMTVNSLTINADASFTVNNGLTVGGTIVNDGTLVIDGSDAATNGTLLTKATGTGDVEITAATTVPFGVSSQLTGKLTINGATLNMKAGLGKSYNLSSFTSGEWKGATIDYHALGSTFQNVTVSGDEASYITIKDMGQSGVSALPAPIILSGTTTLNKNLEVSSTEWKYSVKIEKLTGNGNLTFNGSSKDHLIATIESFDNYGGDVSFTSTATGKTKELTLGKDASSILNFATNSSVTASNSTTTLIKGQVTGNATISGDRIDIEALLAGSASISGNTINISSNQEIGGVVSLTGTTLSLAGVTVLNGGNLSIEGSTTFTNTITNAGTLSLNGNLSINDITRLEVADGATETFSDGSHGYLNATYKVVDNTGTVTLNEATLNGLALFGGGNDDVNVMIATSSGDYYVNSAAEALVYNTGDTATSKVAADTTTGIILQGGNLNMVTGLNAAATSGITAARDATINLGGDATLNQSDLHLSGGTITLTGSGIYDLGSNTSTNVSGLTDASWSGIVKISNATIESGNGILLGNYGNAGSTIQLENVVSFQPNALTNDTCDSDIKLEGEGWKITDGWSDNYSAGITFNGDFSGGGKLQFAQRNETSINHRYIFTGDLSAWTGAIEHTSGGANMNVYLVFKDNVSEINTSITGGVGTLNLTADADVHFTKEVDVTSVSVKSGKIATVSSTLEAGTVTNDGKIQLGKVVTSGETEETQVTATISGGSMSNVQMSSTGIDTTATGGSKGSINNALVQLAKDATFTIEDMTLTGTTSISATEGTAKVTLNNVTATSHLKLNATAANSFVAAGGDESGSISYSYGLGLGSAEAETNSITLNLNVTDIVQPTQSGLYTLTVTLSNFVGTDFDDLDVDAWKSLVGFDQDSWLGEALVHATYTTEAVTSAETGEAAPTVSYGYSAGGSNVGTLTITITGLNVPEPASATLSLLALAALAARRRRK